MDTSLSPCSRAESDGGGDGSAIIRGGRAAAARGREGGGEAAAAAAQGRGVRGRGLHYSTFQLNLSALYGDRGVRKGIGGVT